MQAELQRRGRISSKPYAIAGMDGERYTIEIEPEVSEPYSRHLGGKLRELRFDLGDDAQRISYWIAPGRRVVLLTVFHKTKTRETAEVERARAAQVVCEADHERAAEHDIYSRNLKGELQ